MFEQAPRINTSGVSLLLTVTWITLASIVETTPLPDYNFTFAEQVKSEMKKFVAVNTVLADEPEPSRLVSTPFEDDEPDEEDEEDEKDEEDEEEDPEPRLEPEPKPEDPEPEPEEPEPEDPDPDEVVLAMDLLSLLKDSPKALTHLSSKMVVGVRVTVLMGPRRA